VSVTVLFSGGVDSLIHARWAQAEFGACAVRAVYYDAGQPYAARESAAAAALCERLRMPFSVDRSMRLQDPDGPESSLVPFRNAFFLLAAAADPACTGVVFGMLRGESPPDKNPRFVRRMQRLIASQCVRDYYHPETRPVRIHVPFSWSSKTQMMRWHIRRYGTDLLALSVACHYDGGCGRCWSCFNRWLAWRECGLPDELYAEPPAEWLLEKLREMWAGRHGGSGSGWWRGVSVRSVPSRADWLLEAWRHLDAWCRHRYGTTAWRFVTHP
jgi:7-cyano-7-deazaguanine synthase in queuosine biosynthesis